VASQLVQPQDILVGVFSVSVLQHIHLQELSFITESDMKVAYSQQVKK